jgi:hypothetical protein
MVFSAGDLADGLNTANVDPKGKAKAFGSPP